MDELMRIAKEHHFTADQLIQEAECVEEYGEWQHMLLLGYSADMLRNPMFQRIISQKNYAFMPISIIHSGQWR